jgi:hypothetical protein
MGSCTSMYVMANAAFMVWHDWEFCDLHLRWDNMFVSIRLDHLVYVQCTVG